MSWQVDPSALDASVALGGSGEPAPQHLPALSHKQSLSIVCDKIVMPAAPGSRQARLATRQCRVARKQRVVAGVEFATLNRAQGTHPAL